MKIGIPQTLKSDNMLIYIHNERISEAVAAIYREAAEANERGDLKTFFELSYKALDLVDGLLKNQEKKYNNLLKVV